MDDDAILAVLARCVGTVRDQLDRIEDWRRPGERDGQYGLDLATDGPAVQVLVDAGLGVLSEESGRHHPERDLCAVIDPVDGSTNASRRIPWYATSIAVLDGDGVRVAMVVNHPTGTIYTAVRGGGATRDGRPIRVAETERLDRSLIVMNGHAPVHGGWSQYRALGAAALDICLVAEGAVDAFLDCTQGNLGCWDYLGAMLVLTEAGGVISDAEDRPLVTLDHAARRAPIAAATPTLHAAVAELRRSFGET